LTFALGLVLVMVGLTYGLEPYGSHSMGWTSPTVLSEMIGGVVLLGLFVWIETRVPEPMFHLSLFKIRAFAGAGLANLVANMGRGGLQFMLILWLQGIWLPLHGYSFEQTPLWSGIYLVPMSIGFLVAGPLAGKLSDKYGQRSFCVAGMVLAASSFFVLLTLPINFSYPWFALLALANGIGVGLFSAPNTTTIMNAVPADQRGVASGMRATFMNPGFVLSIGIFFSLMIVGLAARLPTTLSKGLMSEGVPASVSSRGGPTARRDLVRGVSRIQPDEDLAGDAGACGCRTRPSCDAHRQDLLPRSHLRPVSLRPDNRVLGGGLPVCCGRYRQLVGGQLRRDPRNGEVSRRGRRQGGGCAAGEVGIVMAPAVSSDGPPTLAQTGEDGLFRIGEAAEVAGVSCRTLRYYQELELLVPA
jgi:hypothetical protein